MGSCSGYLLIHAARLVSFDEDPILRKLFDMLMRFISPSMSLKNSFSWTLCYGKVFHLGLRSGLGANGVRPSFEMIQVLIELSSIFIRLRFSRM